jgi:hypothetical protein
MTVKPLNGQIRKKDEIKRAAETAALFKGRGAERSLAHSLFALNVLIGRASMIL